MLRDKLIGSKAESAPPPPPSYIAMSQLANQSFDTSRTLNAPAHNVGDYIVAMTGRRSSTQPTLASGYINITSANTSARSFRIQYRVATGTSASITFVGAYAHIWIIRGASSILQSNTVAISETVTRANLPDLSGLTDGSIIIAGSYVSNILNSVSSPYVLTNSTGGRIENNTNSSLSGDTMTFSSGIGNLTYGVEIR
jgi:hypothetical protein